MMKKIHLSARQRVALFICLAFLGILGAFGIAINRDGFRADIDPTTQITNQASLTYKDSLGNSKEVKSNIVTTTIQNEQAYTYTFQPNKWYLFALSGKPTDGDPANIFSAFGGQEYIDGRLYRYDAPAQGLYNYDMYSEPGGNFGNLDTGMGFWVNVGGDNISNTISYTGTPETSPKIISLDTGSSHPNGGWTIIGNPFNQPISVDSNIKLTKNGETKSFYDAAMAGWIQADDTYVWDGERQGLKTVSPAGDPFWGDTQTIEPNQGAWIHMLTNGLSMEISL